MRLHLLEVDWPPTPAILLHALLFTFRLCSFTNYFKNQMKEPFFVEKSNFEKHMPQRMRKIPFNQGKPGDILLFSHSNKMLLLWFSKYSTRCVSKRSAKRLLSKISKLLYHTCKFITNSFKNFRWNLIIQRAFYT